MYPNHQVSDTSIIVIYHTTCMFLIVLYINTVWCDGCKYKKNIFFNYRIEIELNMFYCLSDSLGIEHSIFITNPLM